MATARPVVVGAGVPAGICRGSGSRSAATSIRSLPIRCNACQSGPGAAPLRPLRRLGVGVISSGAPRPPNGRIASTQIKPGAGWHQRGREEGSRPCPPVAAATEGIESNNYSVDQSEGLMGFLSAFYRFTRPHTMIGTALGVVSVSLLAVQGAQDFTAMFVVGLMQALSSALLMNIAIVGINQCYDVDIDKVNKPYLPLASGEFSMQTAWGLVLGSCAVSLVIGGLSGSAPLMYTLVISALLGVAYSTDLPFLRWKRSPVLAATCILVIRAVFVQLGFFGHMRGATLGAGWSIAATPALAFALSFMCLFSIAIALSKDIPDVEGDRTEGIRTFSVRMGQTRVFQVVLGLLYTAYGMGVVAGIASGAWWSKLVTVVGHIGLALSLRQRSQGVDLASPPSIYSWYMHVWKLFYLEYLILPFALRF